VKLKQSDNKYYVLLSRWLKRPLSYLVMNIKGCKIGLIRERVKIG